MKTPGRTRSAETLLDGHGLYHLTRLKADADLQELATQFAQIQTRLAERITQSRDARVAAMEAMAVRDGRRAGLDVAIRNFFHVVCSKVQTNRRSAIFQSYFPDGLGHLIGLPLEAKILTVGVLLANLAEEEDGNLKAAAVPLGTALEETRAAVEAYEAAVGARADADGRLRMEKLSWLNAYKESYYRLRIHFIDDLRMAETYFKPERRRPSDEEEQEEPEAEAEVAAEAMPVIRERAVAMAG